MTHDEAVENFCKNVKLLREREGLTKKEMAKICGIGIASLEKLERGIMPKRLSVGILFALAQYCGIENPGSLSEPLKGGEER